MATYVYKFSDGSLYSWNANDNDQVASTPELMRNGLTKVIGLPALDDTHAWDPVNKTVKVVTAPLPIKLLNTSKFILRFSADEMVAIRASTDEDVQHIFYALSFSTSINLNDPDITNGLALLVIKGLLQQSRVAEIVA